ncbi:MAG: hypothetical protein COA78_29490 [Blastopirellula sp.]|nr:MAG: hypothetical protein COA78_29490 [Blastopirellula sp.]
MKFACQFLLSLSLIICSTQLAFAETEDGFTPLFNGKDLTDWVNINGGPDTWSVKDGMIHCTGQPIAMMRTERQYQNFIVELEWRHLKPKGNSGIFVWANPLPAQSAPFLKGIEVQILDGREGSWYTSDGDVFPTWGATMKPINGRDGMRAFPTEKRMKGSPEWNHYRITCIDGNISLAVNGKIVTQGQECNPRKGYISLESEGSPVDFRNIRIKELPATDIDPAMVASKDQGFKALYNSTDLTGWKTENADHWIPAGWALKHDGERGDGDAQLWSEKSYRNFEMIIDWRFPYNKDQLAKHPTRARQLVQPDGSYKLDEDGNEIKVEVPDLDSGVYLRGSSKSQINMWTWNCGSGEVYGYRNDKSQPAEVRAGVTPSENADLPIGKWNRFHITMRGDRLTVVLNGKTVIENAQLPGVPESGPIALQHHGCKVEFANIFIRELDD